MFHKNAHVTLLGALGALTLLASSFLVSPASAQSKGDDAKAELVVGEEVPDFTLTDTEGKEHKLSDVLADKKTVVVLEWFNPGCPVIVRHHTTESTVKKAYEAYKDDKEHKVVWLAINSGAPGMQGHGVDTNQRAREKWHIDYPVLLDESGDVGRAYSAQVTPHMYVIAADGKLLYRGAIDDDRSGRKSDPRNYVLDALKNHFAGKDIDPQTTEPYGCGVKYSR